MATITKPPKKRTLFTAPMIQYAAHPAFMEKINMKRVKTQVTNILNEPPTVDKIYTYNGKNYGRPQFRTLSEETANSVPGQQGFRFSKDKDNVLHLNVIVEAYHPQINVIPLDFREVRIMLKYDGKAGLTELPLAISNILPINKPNILKHIYAHAVIKEEEKEAIYEALVTTAKQSNLMVSADIWWQKPGAKKPTPPPRPKPKKPAVIAESCISFNRNALKIKGTHVYAGNQRLMSFRNVQDAQKAIRVIHHYKMDRRCSVGGNLFSYFLSGNAAPTGTIKGEDCLPFPLAKLKVIQANGRWKITDGRSWMFDFNTNKAYAEKALGIIKKHGFDATCYVGRPKPGMTYLKRTRAPKFYTANLNLTSFIAYPIGNKIVGQATATVTAKPQKIMVNTNETLHFERKDPTVFQGFFDELESKELKWYFENVPSLHDGDDYTFSCRLTNDPNKVFFLPQVYRIGVNQDTGEPSVQINVYESDKGEGKKEYRIRMDFHVEPYFHPGAKKDLMRYLQNISKGEIKYVEKQVLGGYRNVSFALKERFLKDNVNFSENFTEKTDGINPLDGFTITADHSLESFDVFRRELLSKGISIGDVFFELEEETKEGQTVVESRPITVELNLKKLVDIPLEAEIVDAGNKGSGAPPAGFYLKNNNDIPVTVKGVELTLLSADDNFIYDVDLDLSTANTEWPLKMDGQRKENIFINRADVEELSDDNVVWTALSCEPYGIRTDIDPEQIMASVIDRASSQTDMWKLDISCPFYEKPEDVTDEKKEAIKHILGVLVEIETDQGESFSVRLDKDNPRQIKEMARTLKQLLEGAVQEKRKYRYRQTNITDPASQPSDWKDSDNTSVEHLLVYPEI